MESWWERGIVSRWKGFCIANYIVQNWCNDHVMLNDAVFGALPGAAICASSMLGHLVCTAESRGENTRYLSVWCKNSSTRLFVQFAEDFAFAELGENRDAVWCWLQFTWEFWRSSLQFVSLKPPPNSWTKWLIKKNSWTATWRNTGTDSDGTKGDGDAGGDEKGSLLKQGMARRMAMFIGNHDNWLVLWNIFYFSIYWEFHHPNWRSHIIQRGRYTTRKSW